MKAKVARVRKNRRLWKAAGKEPQDPVRLLKYASHVGKGWITSHSKKGDRIILTIRQVSL